VFLFILKSNQPEGRQIPRVKSCAGTHFQTAIPGQEKFPFRRGLSNNQIGAETMLTLKGTYRSRPMSGLKISYLHIAIKFGTPRRLVMLNI
jgi:hypothetical protein